MNEPLITIVGTAGADCQLRFTPQGVAVGTFNVAVTSRIKQGDAWKDGDTTWFRCTAWREMAESCAESIAKGTRVIVHGRFKTRQYEKDSQTRTSIEIDVEEVGPSLRWATAKVQKMARSGGGFGSGGGGGQGGGGNFDDPWATSAPAGNADTARSGGFDDSEPPF